MLILKRGNACKTLDGRHLRVSTLRQGGVADRLQHKVAERSLPVGGGVHMAAAPTTVLPGIVKTYRHDGISFHFRLKVGVAKLEAARQGGDGRMLHVRAAVRTDHLRKRGRRYA